MKKTKAENQELGGKIPGLRIRRGRLHDEAAREAFNHPGRAANHNIHKMPSFKAGFTYGPDSPAPDGCKANFFAARAQCGGFDMKRSHNFPSLGRLSLANRHFMRRAVILLFCILAAPAGASPLPCFGTVAPGLAYPDITGAWRGMEIDLCENIAATIHATPVFTPVLQDSDVPPATAGLSVAFLPAGDIPAGYAAGPVVFNDNQALMVPAGSKARRAADLGNASICVEPGSPEDFHLADYFAAHKIPLHEFVFQETDELHDAYVAGRCDAITARVSLLAGLRANEDGARRGDILLPDNLGDNPIRAATPAGQTDWARHVATIISETEKNAPHS